MIAALDLGSLRGLRDRAILLVGFAGGLRRSEIVGLDCGARQTRDGTGWTEILDKGVLVTLRGKTGWREVEIGRGSRDLSCPVVALEAWLKFARIASGPLFRRVFADGKTVDSERLADNSPTQAIRRARFAVVPPPFPPHDDDAPGVVSPRTISTLIHREPDGCREREAKKRPEQSSKAPSGRQRP
jgi:integrase